jgi:hypothetical protein
MDSFWRWKRQLLRRRPMGIYSSIKSIGAVGSKVLTTKLKAFQDTFTATNSSTALPQTTAKWVATSGTWGITGNKAYSTTAASSYPVATVDTNTKDVVVKSTASSSGSGYGVSFWVTDANNWWGAHTEKTTFSAAPYNCPSGGTAYGSNCNYAYGASGGPYSYCGGCGGATFGCDCYNCCWVFAGPAQVYNASAPYNCPSGGSLSGSTCYVTYGGTLTTWYKHDFKVVKKTAGSVSVVATQLVGNTTSNTDYIAYIQANTQPNSAIITAQMSTGGAVASYTAPAGTPGRSNLHGLIAGPATLSGTTSVETFDYTPN